MISMPFVGEKRRQAHKNAVDACVKANVKQIIYTSVLSAAHPFNPSIENVDHSYTEAIIQNTSLDYIFLRNSLFVEAFTSDYLRAVEFLKIWVMDVCGLFHVRIALMQQLVL